MKRKRKPQKRTKAQHKAYYQNAIKNPRYLYQASVSRAKKRGLPFLLTKEEYSALTAKPCFYCSGLLSVAGTRLDRLDNETGYTAENSVPCCPACNTIKSNLMTPYEMTQVVSLLRALRQTDTLWDSSRLYKRRPRLSDDKETYEIKKEEQE